MPRIDPLKLLTCLSVLLAPNGGIRSANEVKRLANLMAKFSKKLVSKCIYIQILKCTETELLGQFMAAGGWSLVHMWLADGITTKNWPLIQELLELLLCCPVDVERLKSNTAPKLVKSLSKDSGHEGVRLLASKLVEQWLKIARSDIRSGSLVPSSSGNQQNVHPAEGKSSSGGFDGTGQRHPDLIVEGTDNVLEESVVEEECDVPSAVPIDAQQQEGDAVNGRADGEAETDDSEENVEESKKAFNSAVAESNANKSPLLFKITMKNGKQVLAKVESPTKKRSLSGDDEETDKTKTSDEVIEDCGDAKVNDEMDVEDQPEGSEEIDGIEKLEKDDENKVKDEKKEKSESERKDRRKSDEKERGKDRDKSSSKDKDKHKEKDKDRKSSSSSSNHKSSSSKSSSSKHNSSTSSNSGKSKSSSSSSSSGKSSSSSSSSKDKDKDRHNSSTSSSTSSKSKHHHKSSSSSSSSKSSSSSSKSSSSSEKHREHKDKSSHSSKDKEKETTPKASSPS